MFVPPLLIGLVALGAARITDSSGEGPLNLGEGESMSGSYADVGDQVGFQHSVAVNDTERPITLISAQMVSPEGSHPAITQVWVSDLGPDTLRFIGTQWPSDPPIDPATLHPVEGFVLPPGGNAHFTFVVDVDQEGEWVWPELAVTYSYAGDEYTAQIDNALHVCAPIADCA